LIPLITHLTPGTQPRQEPRQPDPATYRQPGNPAAPGSTRQHLEVPPHGLSLAAPGSTRQHPAAPGNKTNALFRPAQTVSAPQQELDLALKPVCVPAQPRSPAAPAARQGQLRRVHRRNHQKSFQLNNWAAHACFALSYSGSHDVVTMRMHMRMHKCRAGAHIWLSYEINSIIIVQTSHHTRLKSMILRPMMITQKGAYVISQV
jgi:hypothetical protein